MPNFKHPCFVCVKDAEKRKELIEWLKMVGYECTSVPENANYIITGKTNFVLTETDNRELWLFDDRYNCNSNIPLFKAIAAINDDNDYMQWFVSNIQHAGSPNFKMIPNSNGRLLIDMNTWFDYEWILVNSIDIKVTNYKCYHKATLEELIEHLNNK